MKRYLLDTSAYSHMLRGHPEVAQVVRSADEVYLSLITIAELRYGFRHGTKQHENDSLLTRFLMSKKVKMLIPDLTSTSKFADIGFKASKAGKTLAHHDLWLAAQAVSNNLTLVSFDRDFLLIKDKDFRLKFLK